MCNVYVVNNIIYSGEFAHGCSLLRQLYTKVEVHSWAHRACCKFKTVPPRFVNSYQCVGFNKSVVFGVGSSHH